MGGPVLGDFLLHANVVYVQISIKGSLFINRIVTPQPLIVPIPGSWQ